MGPTKAITEADIDQVVCKCSITDHFDASLLRANLVNVVLDAITVHGNRNGGEY